MISSTFINLKFNRQAKGGFSLLEVTVVLIITTFLISAVIPQLIKGYSVNAANKVALDMAAIEEASRAYYIANNSWPADIAALQAGEYLPSSWNATNPFGYAATTPANYSYNISSNPSMLTVSTTVPVAAQPTIQNLLPVTSVSGNTIFSSVSVPGASSVVPAGIIAAWSGTIATIPAGWTLCNGVTVERSNGSGTTTPPDLRNQFIVGASQDNGGVAMTGVTGSLTQSGNGQLPATTVTVTPASGLYFSVTAEFGGTPGYYAGEARSYGGPWGSPLPDILSGSFGSGSVNVAVYYTLAFIMKI